MYEELPEIKKIRKKLGLTQRELAEKAGISQSLLAKIESGKINPTYTKTVRIFRILEEAAKKQKISIEEVVNRKIISTRPEENIQNVIALMKRYGISQLPVIEGGKPVGLVTEGDVLERMRKNGTDILQKSVTDVMEECPPLVSIETDIDVVSALLKYFPIVLVAKKGELVGLVAKADILDKVAKL
jgi:predicted transcriptional regulator